MTTDPVSERRGYGDDGLEADDLQADPIAQLQAWLHHAGTSDQGVEASAMTLATVDREGRPAARTVLLRRIKNGRLYFYTSYGSRKARHLDDNANVALLFRWANPARQVEVLGSAVRATAAESDAYFASRPRGSQLGAHASPQSAPIESRRVLDERLAEIEAMVGTGEVPRPEGWGGYVVTPRRFEFWQGRDDRLHDRFVYEFERGAWRISRLAP